MFTVFWFENNIPLWEEKVIPELPDNPKILEIGVYEGYCTKWMCENIPNCKIEIIDTFLGSMENDVRQDLFIAFNENLSKHHHIVNINKGESYEHVRKFSKNYFDFISDIIEKYSKGRVIVLNEKEVDEPEIELAKDVLQIMNVFVAKMNGLRRYKVEDATNEDI